MIYHCHLLLWLSAQYKITPDKVNDVICAEISDPFVDPELCQIVIANMVHESCGCINPNSPCTQDGHCRTRYPKQYIMETLLGADSNPLYKSTGDSME